MKEDCVHIPRRDLCFEALSRSLPSVLCCLRLMFNVHYQDRVLFLNLLIHILFLQQFAARAVRLGLLIFTNIHCDMQDAACGYGYREGLNGDNEPPFDPDMSS